MQKTLFPFPTYMGIGDAKTLNKNKYVSIIRNCTVWSKKNKLLHFVGRYYEKMDSHPNLPEDAEGCEAGCTTQWLVEVLPPTSTERSSVIDKCTK